VGKILRRKWALYPIEDLVRRNCPEMYDGTAQTSKDKWQLGYHQAHVNILKLKEKIMLPLYRAVRSAEMSGFVAYPTSRRVPRNVPYVVDNLWEWLRPKEFPSRRVAAYASPSPELALACAGATAATRNEFAVTTVTFPGQVKIAQLRQKDARDHPDLKELPRAILEFLGNNWVSQAYRSRLDIAPLFLPVISSDEVAETMNRIPGGDELRETIGIVSRFWKDARLLTASVEHLDFLEGEIFFEALDGYCLTPVSDIQTT